MDKGQKPINPEYYASSSEPFRIHLKLYLTYLNVYGNEPSGLRVESGETQAPRLHGDFTSIPFGM
jgi:hypothetical protein